MAAVELAAQYKFIVDSVNSDLRFVQVSEKFFVQALFNVAASTPEHIEFSKLLIHHFEGVPHEIPTESNTLPDRPNIPMAAPDEQLSAHDSDPDSPPMPIKLLTYQPKVP